MDCVFCVLVREDSARWVVRRATAAAFAPIDPIAPGHTLVIPISHYADLFDIPPDVLCQVMGLVQDLAIGMRAALGAGGVNILSAGGPGSQQSVPHLHVHVVPRWLGDGFSTWPAERSKHRLPDDPIRRLTETMC